MREYGHSAKMFETGVQYKPTLSNKAHFAFLTDPNDKKSAQTEASKRKTSVQTH